VMPTQVSGNTNGPVMALAWRAAELIQASNAARPDAPARKASESIGGSYAQTAD
jgi:choline dehydrogenase-like flavoprotein